MLSDRQGCENDDPDVLTEPRFAHATEMTLLVICVVFFVGLVIASNGDLLAANSCECCFSSLPCRC